MYIKKHTPADDFFITKIKLERALLLSSMRLESGQYDDSATLLFQAIKEIERTREEQDQLKVKEQLLSSAQSPIDMHTDHKFATVEDRLAANLLAISRNDKASNMSIAANRRAIAQRDKLNRDLNNEMLEVDEEKPVVGEEIPIKPQFNPISINTDGIDRAVESQAGLDLDPDLGLKDLPAALTDISTDENLDEIEDGIDEKEIVRARLKSLLLSEDEVEGVGDLKVEKELIVEGDLLEDDLDVGTVMLTTTGIDSTQKGKGENAFIDLEGPGEVYLH